MHIMVRHRKRKTEILFILDRFYRHGPFFASSVASEAKLNVMTVVHILRVLRVNGMAEVTPVNEKGRGKVNLYNLTEAFNLEKALELF